MRAPTAGNMMLYSIIEVSDPEMKATLAKTCDNQPFIAKAPWVLLFLADWQRWHDSLTAFDVPARCRTAGTPMRTPEEGDILLACCDALISAQTAVLAAESLGLGSCYVGDIMENWEVHRDLFGLPKYAFPITLLCLGYPTQAQKDRERRSRFEERFVVFKDRYRRLERPDFEEMYRETIENLVKDGQPIDSDAAFLWRVYQRKIGSAFMVEMTRSVRAAFNDFKA